LSYNLAHKMRHPKNEEVLVKGTAVLVYSVLVVVVTFLLFGLIDQISKLY